MPEGLFLEATIYLFCVVSVRSRSMVDELPLNLSPINKVLFCYPAEPAAAEGVHKVEEATLV